MNRIIVTGCGTEVGKTITAAIITECLQGDYWKPIQCGDEKDSDTSTMEALIDRRKCGIHKPVYSFQAPLSPHHAARLENTTISMKSIVPPQTTRPLIIEGVGGVFVPLTSKLLIFDLFKSWNCPWIIVSRHYLGSINHTLLTLYALKQHNIAIAGIVFNGLPNPDSENAILEILKVPILGRLLPEPNINPQTIQRYANQWKPNLSRIL